MKTTRKQFEDALAALMGMEGKPGPNIVPPVRLDKVGLHYGTTTAVPEEWTFDGAAHALPEDLKKAAKEAGKPSAAIGEIVATSEDGPHRRVKMCGVTLPEIGQRNDWDLTPGYIRYDDQGTPDRFQIEDLAPAAPLSCQSA